MPYADPLSDDEIAAGLATLTGWERDGGSIRRTIKTKGFRSAVALINSVADAAEAANHHPDMELRGYNRLTFVLTTHATGGLTQRDVDLAAEIDRLAADVGA